MYSETFADVLRNRITENEKEKAMEKKLVISSRYYPTYYGRRSTSYSYRSWYIGTAATALTRADRIIGRCDATTDEGWVTGVQGATAARTFDAVRRLPGWEAI
jgi:hypothetical protein